MGGHMSAAATSITIEHDISRVFFSDRNAAAAIGWKCDQFPTSQVIQGIVHVDDALICSKMLCSSCIEEGLLQCWPRDIGMEVEQRNPQLKFLHIAMTIRDEISMCPIDFFPSAPNADFATGICEYPMVAKIPPYLGPLSNPAEILRPFMSSKFAMFNQVFAFEVERVSEPLAVLLGEVLRMGWPPKMVTNTLRMGWPPKIVTNTMMSVGQNVRNPFRKVFMMTAIALKKFRYDEEQPAESFHCLVNLIECVKDRYLTTAT